MEANTNKKKTFFQETWVVVITQINMMNIKRASIKHRIINNNSKNLNKPLIRLPFRLHMSFQLTNY